jgi:nucleotide-binding universal stress UspA family protein
MYKRILLAFDGSNSGSQALLECGDVANLMQAEIKLLAVTPAMPPVYVGEGFIPTDTLETEKERFRKILEEGIHTLKNRGFACQGQLSFGEPVDEIARVAKEWGADLIVIGHRKAGSWAERWWRGSVTRTLIEIAPCSLLVAIIDSKKGAEPPSYRA